MENEGIEYSLPEVKIISENGIGHTEYAGRIAYDSFSNSEHECIREHNLDELNTIDSSELLDQLAWVHHHHSVLEHTSITYLIKGTSRGVLQELVRHRVASYTVRSTRYTMSSIINAFIASNNNQEWFQEKITELDVFVTTDSEYNNIQIADIFTKLHYQKNKIGDAEFLKISASKKVLLFLSENQKVDENYIFNCINQMPKKRNVGDAFKHIVNTNWKVDLVVTFNLRSLKNYFTLRDSGAAWFQIRWLAKEMKSTTPVKYLRLIEKSYR